MTFKDPVKNEDNRWTWVQEKGFMITKETYNKTTGKNEKS